MPEIYEFDLPDFDTADAPDPDWDPNEDRGELELAQDRGSTMLTSEPRERKWMLMGTGLCGVATAVVVTCLTAGPELVDSVDSSVASVASAPAEGEGEGEGEGEIEAIASTFAVDAIADDLDGQSLATALLEPASPQRYHAPPPPPLWSRELSSTTQLLAATPALPVESSSAQSSASAEQVDSTQTSTELVTEPATSDVELPVADQASEVPGARFDELPTLDEPSRDDAIPAPAPTQAEPLPEPESTEPASDGLPPVGGD